MKKKTFEKMKQISWSVTILIILYFVAGWFLWYEPILFFDDEYLWNINRGYEHLKIYRFYEAREYNHNAFNINKRGPEVHLLFVERSLCLYIYLEKKNLKPLNYSEKSLNAYKEVGGDDCVYYHYRLLIGHHREDWEIFDKYIKKLEKCPKEYFSMYNFHLARYYYYVEKDYKKANFYFDKVEQNMKYTKFDRFSKKVIQSLVNYYTKYHSENPVYYTNNRNGCLFFLKNYN